jgi:hypothetical protein
MASNPGTSGGGGGNGVSAPLPTSDGGLSPAITFVQPWVSWAVDPLCYPKFDGVSKFTGVPSNSPDPVSEHHVIALLRQVDAYLEPRYEGYVDSAGSMPKPKKITLS